MVVYHSDGIKSNGWSHQTCLAVAPMAGGDAAAPSIDASVASGGRLDVDGDEEIRMIGVEAGGTAIEPGKHAARFAGGSVGMLQGALSYVLQDEDGQILGTHSVSAGLDYASVGPEHAHFHDSGRIEYTHVSDDEALEAFQLCSKLEGIIPALETAHAIAHASKIVPDMPPDEIVILNMSGRGDKDVTQAAKLILPDEDLA